MKAHVLFVAILASTSCSKAIKKPEYKSIPKVNDVLPKGLTETKDSGSNTPTPPTPPNENSPMCQAWSALAANVSPNNGFQIFRDIYFNNKTGNLEGRIALAEFPQAHFALSQEYALSIKDPQASEKRAAAQNEELYQKFGRRLEQIEVRLGEIEDKLKDPKTDPKTRKSLGKEKGQLEKERGNLANQKNEQREIFSFCNAAEDRPGTGPKLIDPPTHQKFMALAECAYKKGELSWVKWSFLQRLSYEGQMGKRNEAVQEKLEAKFPGILTGQFGNLEENPIFAEFLNTLPHNLRKNPNVLSSFNILALRVKLFESETTQRRTEELEKIYTLLNREINTANNPKEAACHFGLLQRFQAQLLTLKGFSGAPKLLDNYQLPALPTNNDSSFSEFDRNGFFETVASKPWIAEQMSNPSALSDQSTPDFLNALNYFTKLSSLRSSNLFKIDSQPVAHPTLKADLAKLNVGYFAILAPQLKRDRIRVVGTRIHIVPEQDDHADELAKVGLFALEAVKSFSPLLNIEDNATDRALFTEEQIAKFTDPNLGILKDLNRLMTGFLLEALSRDRDNQGSLEMRKVIRAIGEFRNSDYLKNYKKEEDSQQ